MCTACQHRWWDPQASGSTTGIVTESTSREESTTERNPHTGNTSTMEVKYDWDVNAPAHLIRIYTGFGANMAKTFNNTLNLQTYVRGDGTGNRFRFVVRDGAGGLEACPKTAMSAWRYSTCSGAVLLNCKTGRYGRDSIPWVLMQAACRVGFICTP